MASTRADIAGSPIGGAQTTVRPQPGGARRFLFIDALRGIASLAVMLFHFYFSGGLNEPLLRMTPEFLSALFLRGSLGVDVFFIISGFVIAYTHRAVIVNIRYLGSFIVRRSLRLDPPYWLTLALLILLMHNRSQVLRPEILLSNLFYLPSLLERPVILLTAWTLCYEVQFYLVLICLIGFSQHISRGRSWLGWSEGAIALFMIPLTLYSLAITLHWLPNPLPGLFIDQWYMFALGAMIWWALDKRITRGWLWGFLLLILGVAAMCRSLSCLVCVLTGVTIFLVGRRGRLNDLLSNRPLQFLGMISYSLYLLHPVIGLKIERFGARLTGDSIPGALLWFTLACVASILAAAAMYYFVEQPCVELGRKLKARSLDRTAAPDRIAAPIPHAAIKFMSHS
jgi:peptidoglycan/LPS O-acetylase OafA/YrhL